MTSERRATIIHGYGAAPGDHWFGWLADRLHDAGIPASVPALPDPHAPEPDRWLRVVEAAVGTPDSGSVVVAHSLGCLAVLRHLGALATPWRLGHLVLVSGFLDTLPALPVLDSFIGEGMDLARLAGLRSRIDRLTIIRSDEDRYVPVDHTDRLAALLGTSSLVVPDAGHFLAADGVTSLPCVLEAVA